MKSIEENDRNLNNDIPIYRSESWEWRGGVDGELMQALTIGWESYGRSIKFEFIEGREHCEKVDFGGVATVESETLATYLHNGCNITFKLNNPTQIEAIVKGCDSSIGENCLGFGGLYEQFSE